MTEPGWRKTKDPMYKCVPPKRWISAPMARASGRGDRGFCEEPEPIAIPKLVSLPIIPGSPQCNNLSDIVGKYKNKAGSTKCKHLRQIVRN